MKVKNHICLLKEFIGDALHLSISIQVKGLLVYCAHWNNRPIYRAWTTQIHMEI